MSEIKIEIQENGVVDIILNRPQVNNALNKSLILSLTQTLKNLAQEETTRLLCLRGAGAHFCAGGDVQWMQDAINLTEKENKEDAKALSCLLETLYNFPAPVVAMVQGAAYGGAIGLLACCDIVIAHEQASFCFSEVKLGLIPALISPYVIKAIGERQARRYFLTAEIFTAATAGKLGLVHEVVSHAQFVSAIDPFLSLLLKNSSPAMKVCKSLFSSPSLKIQAEMIERLAHIRISSDAIERMGNFLNGSSKKK